MKNCMLTIALFLISLIPMRGQWEVLWIPPIDSVNWRYIDRAMFFNWLEGIGVFTSQSTGSLTETLDGGLT